MTNKAKQQSMQNGKAYLKERFIDVEKHFIDELRMEQRANTHDPTLGDGTESSWIKLLRRYLPNRYQVAKAFAVDHLGNTTDQLDCLIYDAHFTPSLYGRENRIYVPAEAVYGTFEIKQEVNAPHLKAAADKAASLRKLQRTSAPLESSHGLNKPKTPFPLICGLLSMNASWKDGLGTAFHKQLNQYSGDKQLDFVLTAESGFYDNLIPGQTPQVVTGEGSLIRGLFRLLRALRSKASVAAVEWEKYESVFE